MPSSVYSCVHAHLLQMQWAGRRWATRSYIFKGRDVCALSRPRTEAAVRFLTDPANDLLHARLPCHEPGHRAVHLQECHEDHLHLPNTEVGPTMQDHGWLTGLQAAFRSRLPSPSTQHLLYPVRHNKATKRTRQSAKGDAYVVGQYRDDNRNPACPGLSMPFVGVVGNLRGGGGQRHPQRSPPPAPKEELVSCSNRLMAQWSPTLRPRRTPGISKRFGSPSRPANFKACELMEQRVTMWATHVELSCVCLHRACLCKFEDFEGKKKNL